jgi:hypothetical protein
MNAELLQARRKGAAGLREIVDAAGSPGPKHQCGCSHSFQRHTRADRKRGGKLPPARDDARLPVGLVAENSRVLEVQDPADLFGDRGEDLQRWALFRHQRGHSSQGGLLLGQPRHLGPRLGVRDGGGDQLGEVGETCLGVWRKQLMRLPRMDEDRAP